MQDALSTLIKVTAASELAVEAARHGLIAITGQYPEKAFNLLDNNGSGFITVSEIAGFLRNFGLEVTDADVRTMVKFYDSSSTKRLSTEDFIMAITPREENTAPKRREDKELDMALVRFFGRELELISKTRSYRHKINDAKNGVHEALHCIDTKGKEHFTKADLEVFLQKNHASLSSAELTAVFHRIDRNDSGKVFPKEFQDYLLFDDSARPQPAPKVTREVSFSQETPQEKPKSTKPKAIKIEEPIRVETHNHDHHSRLEHVPVTTTSAYFPSYETSTSSVPKFKHTYYPPYKPNYFDSFPSQTSYSTYSPSHSHSHSLSHSATISRSYESTYAPPLRTSYAESDYSYRPYSTYTPKYTPSFTSSYSETYVPKYSPSSPSYSSYSSSYSSSIPRYSKYSQYEGELSSPSLRKYIPYEPYQPSTSYSSYRSTYTTYDQPSSFRPYSTYY